ncbi:MAG TPA: oligosaccharide flippase family protein [Usitatibacter sp.]|nr:oligosaccharide flippase family protein [Usitatibacter sp.]
MSAVSASLERRALSLGTANAIDYALQFMLPMVLTRTLDPHSFGEYRLLWLAVATLILVTPMCMPHSLYYFLPRSDKPTQRLYINQTLIYMVFAGLVAAWALSELNPFLPGKLEAIHEGQGIVVPVFVLMWVFAMTLDLLPTAEEQVTWQARAIVSLSAIRAVALSLAAIVTGELGPVLWTLCGFAALKAALLVHYVSRRHGLATPVARKDTLVAQVRQAAPFAASGILHGIRQQGDQWIVAALFTVAQFASFSVATVLAPLVHVFRQSVNHVFLPSMSRLEATKDHAGMLALNSRANCMVALLVYPTLAFVFVFAEQVITLVYTSVYLDAVPVLRLYTVALVAFVVELVSTLFVLRQGSFAAKVNGLVLVLALPLSVWGAMNYGLMGAAMGSVAAIYAERLLSLQKISQITTTPIGKLQDWETLARLLVAAVLAAGLAGLLLKWSEWSSFATLLAGGLIMAVAYPAALYFTGRFGDLVTFIDSVRNKTARA